jgi:quercetin dioxygenase-like cupin family protein
MKKNSMTPMLQTKPYALRQGEGRSLQSVGASISIKATADQTNGGFNLFEVTCLPGYATALHIHYNEDVAIFVLAGALTFFWGSEKKQAQAGSFFFQPRGIPHGFRVEGTKPARILYLTFPAGLDRFVMEQEMIAPDFETVTNSAQYKIEVLGPLPE